MWVCRQSGTLRCLSVGWFWRSCKMSCSHMPIQIFLDHCTAWRFFSLLAWLGYTQALFSLCVRSKVLKFLLEMGNVCFFHLETFKSPFLLCSIFFFFFVCAWIESKCLIVLNSWKYQSSGLLCQSFKYGLKNVAWKRLHYSSTRFIPNCPCFCSYYYKTR